MSGYCVAFDPTVGVGGLGSNVPQTSVRDPVWMNLDNNIRSKTDCNSQPIINVGAHIPQTGNLVSNWYVNETGRGEVNPANVEQLNLKGNEVWNNLSFKDYQKTTTKETTEFAYAGNAQRENDGTEFWTYDDGLKTTTKETTEFAYAGNAQRENDGTEFWTYDDGLKTTTKETTEFAYAGNVARGDLATKSYNQYTGYNEKDGSKSGGADTYAIRGATLVENWVSPAGRQNLLGEAEARMGKIDFGTFGSDQNFDGPGTIRQAIPDAGKYQNNYFIGGQTPSPNKLMAVDDRQIAGYQVEQLQQNPLSVFTINPNAQIPGFEEYTQPQSFSTMVQKPRSEIRQPSKSYQGFEKTVENMKSIPVYPSANGSNVNPNSALVYNQNINEDGANQFLVHENKLNTDPRIVGKSYSNQTDYGWNAQGIATNNDQIGTITLGGQNEPKVYGNLYNSVNIPSGMAQGINNQRLQSQQSKMDNPNVCQGNPQLSFATNMLVLESVGGN